MSMIRIGQTEVAYELHRTGAILERRITMTADHVEELALTTDNAAEIEAFLSRKGSDSTRSVSLKNVTASAPWSRA